MGFWSEKKWKWKWKCWTTSLGFLCYCYVTIPHQVPCSHITRITQLRGRKKQNISQSKRPEKLPKNKLHCEVMSNEKDTNAVRPENEAQNNETNTMPRVSSGTNCRAYLTVAVLFIINLLNYMDRFTIAGTNKYLIYNSVWLTIYLPWDRIWNRKLLIIEVYTGENSARMYNLFRKVFKNVKTVQDRAKSPNKIKDCTIYIIFW